MQNIYSSLSKIDSSQSDSTGDSRKSVTGCSFVVFLFQLSIMETADAHRGCGRRGPTERKKEDML